MIVLKSSTALIKITNAEPAIPTKNIHSRTGANTCMIASTMS